MPESNTSARPLQESPPDLSVVIVSWNVRDLLARCLSSLLSPPVHGHLSLEVIVVDNASHDGSAQCAGTFPGVRVVPQESNLGYARANNLGLREAQGRHLLVLNPDTVPCPGSLEALVGFIERTPIAGIASPRLVNADGSVQRAAFRFPTLLMAALDLFPPPRIIPGRLRRALLDSRLNGRYPEELSASKPFQIDHPLGACMLLNRRAYEELGGFDPRIFMYAEEIDLAIRYSRAGWECWQVPAARVVHLGGQSTRQMPDRMYTELWRSRLYIYDKHYPLPARAGLQALLALAQLKEIASAGVKSHMSAEARVGARRRIRRSRRVLRMALGR